ncbi:hypothetical protein apy_06790 [Aeropyrum pernix]|uniref:DUF4350 domain-containing protein n=1 Tax=Aeropyrum pernix TaxID=56636 RepID=A0A401H966_AERPX|nr:hypothetical protein [Aeropyrum pernix]GBF08954.1 hypothetical protein apy_06790 [Aeropyrum pernix]
MRARAILLFAIITGLVLSGAAVDAAMRGELRIYTSTSPSNPSVFGASGFYEAAREAYGAVLVRSIGELEELAVEGGASIVYVVIAPDKPFTYEEYLVLSSLASQGRLKILVMDETIVSNWLLERLVGARVSGEELVVPGASGGWQYIVDVDCGPLGRGLASKPSFIEEAAGGDTICTADIAGEERVLAVKIERGGFKALVVADSSMCANFMLDPPPWLGGGNKGLCLGLLGLLVEPGDIVVFDDAHYKGIPLYFKYGQALAGLAAVPARALSSMWAINPYATLASLIAVSTALSALARPWRPLERPLGDEMLEKLALYAIQEAARRDPILRAALTFGVALRLRPLRRLLIERAYRVLGVKGGEGLRAY